MPEYCGSFAKYRLPFSHSPSCWSWWPGGTARSAASRSARPAAAPRTGSGWRACRSGSCTCSSPAQVNRYIYISTRYLRDIYCGAPCSPPPWSRCGRCGSLRRRRRCPPAPRSRGCSRWRGPSGRDLRRTAENIFHMYIQDRLTCIKIVDLCGCGWLQRHVLRWPGGTQLRDLEDKFVSNHQILQS